MTIQDLKDKNLLLFECITGSRAYGLDHALSDTDIKGVFIAPKEDFYGLNYIPQVNNETNDEVYYELGRFVDLLLKSNPSVIELLHTPEDKILYEHPLFSKLKAVNFLSKRCKDSFAGYAMTQVRKASGLNKKIRKPFKKEKKSILQFCYILHGQGSMPFLDWLEKNELQQEQCGLVNINHVRDLYGLYYDKNDKLGYMGVMHKTNATMVHLSSIPKGEKPLTYLSFNEDGYKTYCKDYRDYWQWVKNRNETRYENTLENGKNYDSKNMMHTFRLLNMAEEILREEKVNVRRLDREELFRVKNGDFTYEELMQKAEEKQKEIQEAYSLTNLPDNVEKSNAIRVLTELRTSFYS